jgi:SAM-dependent methyltransferase
MNNQNKKLRSIAIHLPQLYSKDELGTIIQNFRNEDLENQTYEDESFDIIVTSDVMEHVYNPEKAFKEIARTLKRGGAHIFTVPIINKHKKTEVWAILGENDQPEFLKTPEFHGNPVNPEGSPMTMHYGYDIIDLIKRASGLETEIVSLFDKKLGIMGEYNEVFISRKVN